MKISASIYSNKGKGLDQLVRELDAHGIDMFHVDCEDDCKVFDDIARIRKISTTPIDLHIISTEPEKYFARIEELQIEFVSFQYENLKQLPSLYKNTKTKFGLSIISSTGIDVFESEKDDYSFIVMMSTTPGKSGGVFNRESFQKIIEFKHRFPKTRIHVDGGVNDEIAYILRVLGVNAVVSGSYLLNHQSLSAGMLSFHKAPNGHHTFKANEFATPVFFLPVLKEMELEFKNVLQTIEKYALGFTLIVDDTGKLSGVVSNADVRRGLLKNLNALDAIKIESITNKNPVVIKETFTVSDIIRLLNELNFIVLFLPVVDENNVLKGCVLLNNLTRV